MNLNKFMIEETENTEIKNLSLYNQNEHIRNNMNTLNPDELIKYEGLGVEIKGKGLKNINDTRNKNLGQFFTSLEVSKLIVDLLKINKNSSVFDNSMGVGRLAFFLPNKSLFFGVEKETQVFNIAKKIFTESTILKDDLINHVYNKEFDYCLFNPPFSMNLKTNKANLKHISYGGGILSQVASIEIGIRAVKENGYFCLIAPSNLWELESTRKLHEWTKQNSNEILNLKLPKETFIGTEWETSLYIFKKKTDYYTRYNYNNGIEKFSYELNNFNNIDIFLKEFQKSEHYKDILNYSNSRDTTELNINIEINKKEVIKKINKSKLDFDLKNKNMVYVSVVNDRLKFKANSQIYDIQLSNIKANYPVEYDYSLKEYIKTIEQQVNLNKTWSNNLNLNDYGIFKLFDKYNIKYKIKDNVYNYIKNKTNFFKRENTPFEQYIKKNDCEEWEETNTETGIRTTPQYKEYAKILKSRYNKHPHLKILWDFQKDDVIRMSIKRSGFFALEQGLGKTKIAIATAILKNSKRTLFVVPSKLINTWKDEFKNFKIEPFEIKNEDDLNNLEKFNLISYNVLKKKLKSQENKFKIDNNSKKNVKSGKMFADRIKRLCNTVIIDEAHYLSNSQTEQTKAVSRLRPKNIYYLTGTPINNRVDNIYSLLNIGWKEQSPLFPYNKKQFIDDFVNIEWVTPEYEDTLSTGRTAQKIAQIKNPDLFIELMQTKWIRRTKAEPQVQKCVKIKKPILKEVKIKPSKKHLEYYKKHLVEFAEIFRKYLHPDREDNHKLNLSIVLAKLNNLQFCSTIPQHRKVNPDDYFSYKGDKTEAQKETIRLIKKNYKENKSIIVFSQRPDYMKKLKEWLKVENIESNLFIGENNINIREQRLQEFKDGDVRVLLTSIKTSDTGLNIPQAQVGIITEPSWKYSELEQAYSRMLRPQTKERPQVYLMRNMGMIDEYLWQHCITKKDAINEVLEQRNDIEHQEFKHWTDFIYRMLESEGLM